MSKQNKKKTVHLRTCGEQKVELYCEISIASEVLTVLLDRKLIRKTRRIIQLMLSQQYDDDLYGNYKQYGVTAMKWKGGENIRIYCKEFPGMPKRIVIAKPPHKKKGYELSKKEIGIMNAVAIMEFEFEKI